MAADTGAEIVVVPVQPWMHQPCWEPSICKSLWVSGDGDVVVAMGQSEGSEGSDSAGQPNRAVLQFTAWAREGLGFSDAQAVVGSVFACLQVRHVWGSGCRPCVCPSPRPGKLLSFPGGWVWVESLKQAWDVYESVFHPFPVSRLHAPMVA